MLYQPTFYAEVEEREEDYFLVKGLDINDVNHRGLYNFTVTKETILMWNFTKLTLNEIPKSALIAISYQGPVSESFPANIKNVTKVVLLDEKKGI